LAACNNGILKGMKKVPRVEKTRCAQTYYAAYGKNLTYILPQVASELEYGKHVFGEIGIALASSSKSFLFDEKVSHNS
jgi:hypothetical protein